MSDAYVVGHVTVKNAETWNEYRNQVPATLEPWAAYVKKYRTEMANPEKGRILDLLAALDHTTGYELPFSIFYLLAITFATW